MSNIKLSIIIPTLNAGENLQSCINNITDKSTSTYDNNNIKSDATNVYYSPLKKLSYEIIVIDGGSKDQTVASAQSLVSKVFEVHPGRGAQLNHGAQNALGEWLLFLHVDTILQDNWQEEVSNFIQPNKNAPSCIQVGYFRFALDDGKLIARFMEFMVALRCKIFALPYGDQGLLISKRNYDEVGGFAALPLMEDAEFITRIKRTNGKNFLNQINCKAITSAERYNKDGYIKRSLRNLFLISLYFMGTSPSKLYSIYYKKQI